MFRPERLLARLVCNLATWSISNHGLTAGSQADEAFGLPSTFQRLRESLLVMPAYPDWFREWPGKEAEATELRWYEPLIVPGLLQIEAYARTLLRTRMGITDDEYEAMVAARLERQAILARDKPPTLWVLLDEGVLHRPVGDA